MRTGNRAQDLLDSNTFAFDIGEFEYPDVASNAGKSPIVGFVNEDNGILHIPFVRVVDELQNR